MRTPAVLTLLLALLFSTTLSAQVDLKNIEKAVVPIKIATKIDDKGQQQWDEYHANCPACKAKKVLECRNCKHLETPELCPECKTTRKAPCNYCAGSGALGHPMKVAPCPGCQGHSVYFCYMCGNQGRIKIIGGGKKGVKCGVCKGNGGRACTVCGGKRVVPAAFRGKVGSTKLKKLTKAKVNLDKLIKDVAKFRAVGVGRLDRKRFAGLFKKTKSDFPVLKKFLKQSEEVSKGLDQPRYKDNDKTQVASMERVQSYLLHYLVHQSKVLDLCIERAKFNEKVNKK